MQSAVLLQAPKVTVTEFLKNFFYTAVGAEADTNSHELNVLQMKVSVIFTSTMCSCLCSAYKLK